MLAREVGSPTDELFFRVLDPSASLDAPDAASWNGWYRYRFPEAPRDPSEPVTSGPRPAPSPELRVGGMDLLTVTPGVAAVNSADATFQVISDDAYLWCFRPSEAGTLYLNRLALTSRKVVVGETQETRFALEPAHEVRFQRSGLRDVPADFTDSSSSVDLTGTPFFEPTIELTQIRGAQAGRFAVARVPTAQVGRVAWYVAISGSDGVALTRFHQSEDAVIDCGAGDAVTMNVAPMLRRPDGEKDEAVRLPVFTEMAPALSFYAENDAFPNSEGEDVDVPRQGRLLLAVPVSGAGLGSAMAIYDFSVGVGGQISVPTGTEQALRLVDGTLTDGVFTPDLTSSHYPTAEDAADCVHVVDGLVVNQMLLGQVAPSTSPPVDMLLRSGDDGLLHLYYGGPPIPSDQLTATGWSPLVPGEPEALVAQFDPRVSRLVLELPWEQFAPSEQPPGVVQMSARVAGAIMAGTTVAVTASGFSTAPAADQADLCDLRITYPQGSGLPSETWVGLPRETGAFVAVLNGGASDDSADPTVISGERSFFDFTGSAPQLRLPLVNDTVDTASHPGHLVLTSTRAGLSLSRGSVEVSGGSARLELHYSFGEGGDFTQVWDGLPVTLADLMSILGGGASPTRYDYRPGAGTQPLFALSTTGSSVLTPVLLVPTSSAPADVAGMRVSVTVAEHDRALLDVTFEQVNHGGTIRGVRPDVAGFVEDLRSDPLLATLGLHIDGGPALGSVALTRDPVGAMDLRDGACLFDIRRPGDAPDAAILDAAASLTAGTQRHVFDGDSAVSLTEMVGMAATADSPTNGACAYVVDTPVPAATARASRVLGDPADGGDQPRSGVWVRESPHNAVALGATDALTVPVLENGNPLPRSARLRPASRWTLESWVQPSGSEPQRLVTFADTVTPTADDAPDLDYRIALEGQEVLDFGSYEHTPGRPDSSYAQSNVHQDRTPLPPDAFTWEFWVQPDPVPAPRTRDDDPPGTVGPLGGVIAVDLNDGGPPGLAIGLRADRRVGVETRVVGPHPTRYTGNGVIPDVDLDGERQWSHIAVRGRRDDSGETWTLDVIVNGNSDSSFTQVELPKNHDGATIVIGSKDPYSTSVFGEVAQVRLWATPRSLGEIRRNAFVALAGTEPGLFGCWPLTAIHDHRLRNTATATGDAWDARVYPSSTQPLALVKDDVFLSVVASVGGLPPIEADALLTTGRWNHLAVEFEAGGALELNPLERMDKGLADWMTCSHSSNLVAGSAFSIDAWLRLDPRSPRDGAIASRWAWDKDTHDQSFRFRVTPEGGLGLDLRLVTDSAETTTRISRESGNAGLADGAVHHVAVTFHTVPREEEDRNSTWAITFWVDGKVVGEPHTGEQDRSSIEVRSTQVDFHAGRGLAVPDGAGPQTIDSLHLLRGTLGRLRFWGRAASQAELFPEQWARWPQFGVPEGLVAQWDFLEQEGRQVTDTVGGNDGVVTSSAVWRLLRDTSSMKVYANGALVSSVEPYTGTLERASSSGWWLGSPGPSVRGIAGQVATLTLWDDARPIETIQDQQFTPRRGSEAGLLAGWTFTPDGRDITEGGNDIETAGSHIAASTVPVTIEGAVVRAVYGGVITQRGRSLAGRPAVGSAVDMQRTAGREPRAVVKRTYVVNADDSPDRPIYVGELDLVWVGQVQSDPTLIGFIEGAPPVPSENLTLPYAQKPSGSPDRRYVNTSKVSLVQQAGNTVSFSSSSSESGSLDLSAAVGLFGVKQKKDLNTFLITTNLLTLKNQVQVQFAFHGKWGTRSDTQYHAAWTAEQRDTLGISGDWEPREADPGNYLNPQVGRRFVPENLGYALVESLTADLYAMTFASTGQALGTVVVPNPAIPPDRNVLMFPMDRQDTLAGCLDGKIGLVDHPAYPGADRQRGSFYKPVEGYSLADEITREAERQRAFAAQLKVTEHSDPSIDHVLEQLPIDIEAAPGDKSQVATPRSGLVNRYVWTADGGMHTETQSMAVTSTKSFSGFRSRSIGGGFKGSGEFYVGLGWAWSFDVLGAHSLDVTVGRSEGLSQAVSLDVSVAGEGYLREWDASAPAEDGTGSGAFLPGPAPGKVRQYRFMSIYLPPRTRNSSAFRRVVDKTWLAHSNDPTARAMREIDDSNPVWRVLHRVTYVERVPPPISSKPLQLSAPPEREPVGLAGNAALVELVKAELAGRRPVTRASVGTAVAAVLNPAPRSPGEYPDALVERHVSWWRAFLQRARPDSSGEIEDAEAAAALAKLVRQVVAYVWSGYASGLWETSG